MLRAVESAPPEQRALETDLLAPGLRRSFERAYQILRYYRKRQLAARAWKLTAGRWSAEKALTAFSHVKLQAEARPALRQLLHFRSLSLSTLPPSLVRDLGVGTFTLLGERRTLGRPVDWSAGDPVNSERLWRFQLQYQEYLLDAAATDTMATWSAIAGVIHDWLKKYSQVQASTSNDAWHPYCISRRAPGWLMLLAQDKLPAELRQPMLNSLATQVEWLHQHCETDLGGNHLLENAHALALAGVIMTAATDQCTDVQRNWLKTAHAILAAELPRQILAHGEHYERSPMYHAQILGNLLQIAFLSRTAAPQLALLCRTHAIPMWKFLESILHTDGEIPLFGDSCFGESYPVSQLRSLVSAAASIDERNGSVEHETCGFDRSQASTTSPYWTWRSGDDIWIVDGGAAVENTLPAHGHCDLGGFEASVGGERWFIDGGAFGYGDDAMRRYCRSSIAHNVVTVDDKNHFDIWSRFRLGYRATIERFQTHQENEWSLAHSVHQAYRRLGVGPIHRLTVAHASGAWFCIDHIERVQGRSAQGRLRLAPTIMAEPTGPASWILADRKNERILRVVGDVKASFEQGWYAPRFGERHGIRVLTLESRSLQTTNFGWMLCQPKELDNFGMHFISNGRTAYINLVYTPSKSVLKWSLGPT